MINNPGDRFTSQHGVTYEACAQTYHGPAGSCQGCAGDGLGLTATCRELPTGCSDTDIIWIKVEEGH